jgi:hypothetical protein
VLTFHQKTHVTWSPSALSTTNLLYRRTRHSNEACSARQTKPRSPSNTSPMFGPAPPHHTRSPQCHKNQTAKPPGQSTITKNIRIPGETTRRTLCQHGDTPASGGGQTASRGWQSYIDRVAVTALGLPKQRSGKSAVDKGLRQGRDDNDKVPKYRGELYATAPEEDVTGKESDQVVELVPENFFIYV